MPCFGGMDVAKAQCDMARRPSGERWTVAHDASEVATRVERLQTLQPTLIVREATGGPGARGDERLGRGRPSWGRRAPAAGPRLCPRHGPGGANGGVGCPRPGPLCRRDPPDAPATARRPDARHAGPLGAPPAPDRHADRGAAPLGGDTTSWCSVPRAWGPSGPARCGGHFPRWGRSHGSRWLPWSAWRRFMALVGPSGGGG